MPEKEKKLEVEREYIIPLRKAWANTPRYKKTNKAIKTIKEFLAKHMKVIDRDLNKVKLDKYLNEFVWARGIRNPPSRVKVKVRKQGDLVIAELFELPEKMRFQKERDAKRSLKGEAGKQKNQGSSAPSPEKAEEKTEEQKKEIEEKKAATVEGMEKLEKAASKQAKHQAKGGKEKQSVPRRMTMPK